MAYSSSIAFAGILPLLFLLFNREKEEEEGVNKLFDVLLNYVLSSALLIYAVILYLYFVKVAVLWSLPKGAVAYIVVSFISATFILKSCQPFLERRYYDWFYRYSGWAVLPALVMYWVGTFYRINQYGYTEARVYLVVVGAILTGTVLLFFFPTDRTLFVCGCACRRFVVLCHVYTVHNSEGHRTDLAGKARQLSDSGKSGQLL